MRYLRILLACFFVFFVSINVSVASQERKNPEKESWFMAMLSKAEKKLKEKLETAIDDFFEEEMYKFVGEGIAKHFGSYFAESFSGLISIGPIFSFSDVLGMGQAKESQVMLKVLLKAINEAKEEIIASVEQQFQDETESHLNAIIRELDVYNARSEFLRQSEYAILSDLLYSSNYVLARIEQKQDKYFDNLHLYMLMAGVQVNMQKEYTRWAYLAVHPDASDEEIENETELALRVHVGYVLDHLTQSSLGYMAGWEADFKSQFGIRRDVRFQFEIPVSEALDATYFRERSGYYQYPMGDGWVQFKVLGKKCVVSQGVPPMPRTYRCDYDIFDSEGLFVGEQSGITVELMPVRSDIVSMLRSSEIVTAAIERHKDSPDAFGEYVRDGYLPVKRILDTWWEAVFDTPRYKSEMDYFVEQKFDNMAEISLKGEEEFTEVMLEGETQYRYSFYVSNIGLASAENVKLRMHNTDGFFLSAPVVMESIVDSNGDEVPFVCIERTCTIAEISANESLVVAVRTKAVSGFFGPIGINLNISGASETPQLTGSIEPIQASMSAGSSGGGWW